MTNEFLDQLLERLQKPISEDNPCGENARYDDRYDRSKNEIMKLTAGASAIDWDSLLRDIDELLSEKTKDLTLAAYLGLVLLKQHEYSGLATGLKFLHAVLDTYWESMFPPLNRMKARIQIFEWIDERLSELIHVTKPKQEQAGHLRACKELADQLPEKVQGLVKMQVTGFSRLRTELNIWADQLPKEEAPKPEPAAPSPPAQASEVREEPPAAAPPAQEIKEAAPREPSPAPIAAEKTESAPAALKPTPSLTLPESVDALNTIYDGIKEIGKILNLMRKLEPKAPVIYRMARVIKWDVVENAPPANAEGITKVPAPLRQYFTVMQAQQKAQKWDALANTAEHNFVSITGWTFNMNLQYLLATALENQGAEAAAKTVLQETGRFLLRFPELLNLKYSTGMPFADAETQQWASLAMASVSGPDGSVKQADEHENWREEATKIAKQKSIAGALPIAQDAIKNAKGIKNIMKRQLDVAKFLFSQREHHWAVPILNSLNDKIETIGLSEWDPDFCSEVWENLLRGYEITTKPNQLTDKEISMLSKTRHKLFEANLVKAASLTPKPTKK